MLDFKAFRCVSRAFERSRCFSSVDEVFQLFRRHGEGDYIGEEVSQLEHALQAAELARRSKMGQEAVLAALLHDVGHMLGATRSPIYA